MAGSVKNGSDVEVTRRGVPSSAQAASSAQKPRAAQGKRSSNARSSSDSEKSVAAERAGKTRAAASRSLVLQARRAERNYSFNALLAAGVIGYAVGRLLSR